MNITIRETTSEDNETIYQVEKRAFGELDEADLTEKLLADSSAKPLLSLLAYSEDKAVGHILFTKAVIVNQEQLSVMILGPLAVVPDYQKQGIGGLLIREGLRLLKAKQVELVFVLGHIAYYPKHGFKPALPLGFQAPYPVEKGKEDAWMVQALDSDFPIDQYAGTVRCCDAFMHPEYWRE
ncbi:GNAT family N-acetyltransferase [Enterococcus malodoratus]|uniref:GNAT family N-acetyltransferase n=1 Tax=Enterococcus malodoratus TaxID=71451 RepID=UPI003FD36F3A